MNELSKRSKRSDGVYVVAVVVVLVVIVFVVVVVVKLNKKWLTMSIVFRLFIGLLVFQMNPPFSYSKG